MHLEEAKISCQSLQEQLEAKETYYLSREDELQNLHLSEITKGKFEVLLKNIYF